MWDAELLFSNEQNLATADSDNIVDVGPPDLGKGQPVYLSVNIGSGASGVCEITVRTADDAAMAGAEDLVVFTVPAAKVEKGGSVLNAALPTGCKRYLRLAYDGATGGVITAGLTLGKETSQM